MKSTITLRIGSKTSFRGDSLHQVALIADRSLICDRLTWLATIRCISSRALASGPMGLRRAGIPDSANVWTGSCPCQPFSAAGKGGGFADERHLWPAFHHLIEQCRPDVVLGEQVASKDGLAWLDLVQSDLEGSGYTFGPSDTCSAGFGAPHIRQRLRFATYRMADMRGAGLAFGSIADVGPGAIWDERATTAARLLSRIVGQPDRAGSQPGRLAGATAGHGNPVDATGGACVVADDIGIISRPEPNAVGWNQDPSEIAGLGRPGPTNGFWADCDWLYCRDGKWRPVSPGTFPLAHGDPARVGPSGAIETSSRVGRLKGYGNAVDGEATTEFCRVVAEALGLRV